MKKTLSYENGELIYREDGEARHAGAIKYKGSIYYISSKGRAVKGKHVVHKSMCNGILKHGTYTFGDDCRLIKGSYVKPERIRQKKHISRRGMRAITVIGAILCIALIIFAVVYNHVSDVTPPNAGKPGAGVERKINDLNYGE